MACSSLQEESLDDILKCTICLEVFKTPKYLPCLHTFCHACLNTYIASVNEKTKDQGECGFPCPVCRRRVVIDIKKEPDSGKWADQMPANFLISNIIDKQNVLKQQKQCDPCLYDSKTEIADSWCVNCREALCKNCSNYHKKFRHSRNHTVVGLKNISSHKSETINSLDGFIPCPDHPSECAQMFCRDHRMQCCIVCATIQHRKCDNLVTIEAASEGVKESKETTDLLEKLGSISTSLRSLMQERHEALDTVTKESADIQIQLKTFQDEAKKHIDKICSIFECDLKLIMKNNELEITEENTDLNCLLTQVENYHRVLHMCIGHGTDQECLVERETILRCELEIQKNLQKQAEYVPNRNLLFISNCVDFQSKVTSFGICEMQKYSRNHMKEGAVKLIKKANIGDGLRTAIFCTPDIIAVACYDKERVLFLDNALNSIKEVQLRDSPFDILKSTDRNTIFVSLVDISEIWEIDLETYSAKLFLKMPEVEKYGGMVFLESCWFTACNNQVVKFNGAGKIEEKVSADETWMICHDKARNRLLYGNKSVVKSKQTQSKEDMLLYTNQNLKNVRGIGIDHEDNIYIVGMSSSNIHQISSDGSLIRIIDTAQFGLNQPWNISFNMFKKIKFVVSDFDGDVAVFEIV